MAIRDRKEVFVWLLSNVTYNTEQAARFFHELGQFSEDTQIKEVLEARAFISNKILTTLQQCFKTLGVQPVKVYGKLNEAFVEDFRREFAEIQSPEAKRFFVWTKINSFIHLHMGEFAALVAASDTCGHAGVGFLLESCLADKMAMADHTRRLITQLVEERSVERRAA